MTETEDKRALGAGGSAKRGNSTGTGLGTYLEMLENPVIRGKTMLAGYPSVSSPIIPMRSCGENNIVWKNEISDLLFNRGVFKSYLLLAAAVQRKRKHPRCHCQTHPCNTDDGIFLFVILSRRNLTLFHLFEEIILQG